MAGSWIPIKTHIHEEPEVVSVAAGADMSVAEVVGHLVRLWGWASEVSEDGDLSKLGESASEKRPKKNGQMSAFCPRNVQRLSDTLSIPVRMLVEMQRVGWLKVEPHLAIPHFDYWLSEAGKRRLKDALRKRLERESKGSRRCPHSVRKNVDVFRTTEQNRTEHLLDPPIPPTRGGNVSVKCEQKPIPLTRLKAEVAAIFHEESGGRKMLDPLSDGTGKRLERVIRSRWKRRGGDEARVLEDIRLACRGAAACYLDRDDWDGERYYRPQTVFQLEKFEGHMEQASLERPAELPGWVKEAMGGGEEHGDVAEEGF